MKLRELSQLADVYAMVEVDGEDKGLESVAVSDDGQLLAVSGNSGTLSVYLTRLPVLGDSWQNKIAVLTSLTEITVINEVEQVRPPRSEQRISVHLLIISVTITILKSEIVSGVHDSTCRDATLFSLLRAFWLYAIYRWFCFYYL